MKTTKVLLGFILTVFVFTTLCFAEDDQPTKVSMKSRYIPKSDIDATSSDIEVTESAFSVSHEFKLFDVGLPLELSLNFKHIDITEDDPVDLPSNLESRSFGIGTKFPLPFVDDDRYFMGLELHPTLNTDEWKWESGAFRLLSRAYVIYKESDDFIVVAGVGIRPEYDTVAVPLIGIIWRVNDKLLFDIASDDPTIQYKLTDRTTAFMEFGYSLEEYEVTRGTHENLVLRYQQFSTGAGLKFDLNENFAAKASVGGVFGRRLEYDDGVGKVVPDGGLYAGGQVSAKF